MPGSGTLCTHWPGGHALVVVEGAAGAGKTTILAATRTALQSRGQRLMVVTTVPLSGRDRSFPERKEIAVLKAQGAGTREIARRLGRNPATISRELRRNAATRGGKLDYRASVAQWKAELLVRRPKTAKLAENARLREYVQDRLSGQVRRPDGTPVEGPVAAPWKGRTSRVDKTGAGPRHGARSRSRTDSRSTSLMMSPCASRTRRSTRRCMCEAAERSNGSWSPACAPDARYVFPAPAPASARTATSRLR